MTWIIYGANGYSGRLIAERAVADGKRPILAGRREGPVKELAERLGLPWRGLQELKTQVDSGDLFHTEFTVQLP